MFSFFKILMYGVFRGVKGQKMTLNDQFQYALLYISGTVDHIIEILIMISAGVFLYFFLNAALYILKLFCILLAHFNSFLNNYLFSKFINKCQKEILSCAPPSYVCDFLKKVFVFHKICFKVEVLKTFKISAWLLHKIC